MGVPPQPDKLINAARASEMENKEKDIRHTSSDARNGLLFIGSPFKHLDASLIGIHRVSAY
jgi:hypothetical protein